MLRMIRCILTLVGLLFAGSVGAFLLYVPAFSVLTVSLLLFGVLAGFLLGVHVGHGQVSQKQKSLRTDRPAENTGDREVLQVSDHAA
jgi:hypothetical protein